MSEIEAPLDLDARYGRAPRDRRRVRVWAVITAAAFAVAVTAWLVWGGLLGAPAQIESRDIGFSNVEGDRAVEVRWRVTMQPGESASCALQALDSAFAIVGWKIVDIPPSDERTREFREVVRTTELAETGLIYRCWLT